MFEWFHFFYFFFDHLFLNINGVLSIFHFNDPEYTWHPFRGMTDHDDFSIPRARTWDLWLRKMLNCYAILQMFYISTSHNRQMKQVSLCYFFAKILLFHERIVVDFQCHLRKLFVAFPWKTNPFFRFAYTLTGDGCLIAIKIILAISWQKLLQRTPWMIDVRISSQIPIWGIDLLYCLKFLNFAPKLFFSH